MATSARINYEVGDDHIGLRTQVIIDEFASFATEDFVDFIAKSRSAGIGVAIAHQSRDDLSKVSSTFSGRVEANCAYKIIFRTSSPEDAEYYASMVGTQKARSETRKTEQDVFGRRVFSKEGSVREVEEFRVHPNIFKGLGQGQVIKISGLRDTGHAALDVALASGFQSPEFRDVLKDGFHVTKQAERISFDLSEEEISYEKKASFIKPYIDSKSKLDDLGVFL